MQTFFSNLAAKALDILPNILFAILIVIGTIYLSRFATKLVRKALKKKDADPEFTELICRLTRWGILIAGLIAALQRFFNVTAFLAGLGVIGITIGFAMQDIVKNFVAGAILLIQQPINVGDAILVGNYGGIVLSINLRTTEMRAWDGTVIIIPNGDVLSTSITNYTRAQRRRVDLPVGISYENDPQVARETILKVISDMPEVLSDPAPSVYYQTFGDSSVNLTAYFWIDGKGDLFGIKDRALVNVKAAFDGIGIEIPFPIRTVLMTSQES
jgi:small conductance mechanosensitive channel